MRRKEKEIKDPAEIEAIIKAGQFCRIGLSDGNIPYVVPVCYGYDKGAVYFHCAREGRKLDVLRRNSNVCVEIEADAEIVKKESACKWGLKYKSVIGFGKASILENENEKRDGLAIIMRQYSDGEHEFSADSLGRTLVVKIVLDSIAGKKGT
jgi:uncharacterized protein